MSLLGLVRHLATVEQYWFRVAMAGEQVERLYRGEGNDEFDDAVADAAASRTLGRDLAREVANAENTSSSHDLDTTGPEGDTLREVLLHMIEEYARHCGHADLLRERIDGRIGQ